MTQPRNGQTVGHPYNGILPSNKKEKITDTHNNMDESQVQHAKWKKGLLILFIWYSRKEKPYGQKTGHLLPGAGV